MMEIARWGIVFALYTGAVFLVAWWLGRRPLAIRLAKMTYRCSEANETVGELAAALNDLNASRVEFEGQVRRVVASELGAARAAAVDWERRAEEYRGTIQGVLKERDNWNKLYDEQSIGHGNAQAVMMDAIGHLVRLLRKAGVDPKLPAIIQETQDLYRERHVEPALQRTGGAIGGLPVSKDQTMSAQDQK